MLHKVYHVTRISDVLDARRQTLVDLNVRLDMEIMNDQIMGCSLSRLYRCCCFNEIGRLAWKRTTPEYMTFSVG